ncbi:MAG: pentapeptide repeat-containing protein [Deltaproteobacteria bacterium]|jgi:uncharacterized protein YjbI with pentapeptide repeats|nr:pentapeptide repeat-containing protein [Deltaproteobacteria bacterium]
MINALELHEIWLKTNSREGKQLDLGGTILHVTNFIGADLSWSLFSRANLKEADFSEANLKEADFSEANLKGADFSEANLKGADFSEAKNLDEAIWPKGWRLVKE